jgi:hypothetical protein
LHLASTNSNLHSNIKSRQNNNDFYCRDALVAPEDIRVIGGTKYRYEEESNTFSSLLEEIIIHENFSRSSLENNIAIGIVSDSQHFIFFVY